MISLLLTLEGHPSPVIGDTKKGNMTERVKQVQNQLDLTRLFILSLHNKQVNLAGVNFELSSRSIASATGILDLGEIWFKREKL